MPSRMFSTSQMSTSWMLASSCASSGIVSVKSSEPSCTPSISASMLGWITTPITPPTRMYTPTSATTSSARHPPSVSV